MAIEPPQIPGLTDWRPLARGGFAVVWEARQQTLDRLVAVKVDQRRLDTESERLRFLREAGAAGRMSAHPGIVTVHDAGILADDRPYLVMELCPGGSLTGYVTGDSRPAEARVREIGVRIADALAATHARGVLHRDVKPANILIDVYDRVGLADFGLAALPGPEAPPQEAFQALTPAYTAPEILQRQPPTPAADVYSLAATLYALLGGRPPRWPDGPAPGLEEVVRRQQQPLTPLTDADPRLMEVLERALSLDPAERPTAAGLRDQLAALELAPVGATALVGRSGPGVADGRAERSGRRRAVLVPLAAVVLVALLVGLLTVLDRDQGAAAPPPTATTIPPPGSPASADATPTPSPTASSTPAVPPGFSDCSAELGAPGYCRATPECWTGVISVFELPRLGTRADCETPHVYQTFAAGPLDFEVRRQPQLEADPGVARLCSREVLDVRLEADEQDTAWEVLALPPQEADASDRFFRCLFGRGERTVPVQLRTR